MNNLEIVTYATHNEKYFPHLLQSAKRNNLKLTVLGFNTKWLGFIDKFNKFFDYLNTKNNNDIIMFVDGFDVIFNNTSQKNIISKFKMFNTKILFSKHENSFSFPTCNNNTINTGLYMGYVKYLKILLNNIINFNNDENLSDDQFLMNYYCNNINIMFFKQYTAIDVNNIVFWNISSLNDIKYIFNILNNNNILSKKYEYENDCIKIKNTETYPSVIQAWGGFNIDDIIKQLKYDIDGFNNDISTPILSPFKAKQVLTLSVYSRYYNVENICYYDSFFILFLIFIYIKINTKQFYKIIIMCILLLFWYVFTLIYNW